ncbi:Uncharacterized protein BM_BM14429 [Brugia malayi]|uniref:Bm14429 n=1 Tax=Brugia malayi TaxID=6279 RepID=A0A0K0J145_BRUMA|nr:Uncharacterized protein BM_BM14429 [Brugia malayi]CDQ00490.1 Bm14429 [Brugia malayi]VIO86296.1 Uncharacterized protein BM_BM14429 [Brugia malayi]
MDLTIKEGILKKEGLISRLMTMIHLYHVGSFVSVEQPCCGKKVLLRKTGTQLA